MTKRTAQAQSAVHETEHTSNSAERAFELSTEHHTPKKGGEGRPQHGQGKGKPLLPARGTGRIRQAARVKHTERHYDNTASRRVKKVARTAMNRNWEIELIRRPAHVDEKKKSFFWNRHTTIQQARDTRWRKNGKGKGATEKKTRHSNNAIDADITKWMPCNPPRPCRSLP